MKKSTCTTSPPARRWVISMGTIDPPTPPCSSTGTKPSSVGAAAGPRAETLVIVWNRRDGEELAKVEPQKGRVTSLALSPGQQNRSPPAATTTPWRFWISPKSSPRSTNRPPRSWPPGARKPARSQPRTQGGHHRVGHIARHRVYRACSTATTNPPNSPNIRVVAAYPKGSPDIAIQRLPRPRIHQSRARARAWRSWTPSKTW